MLTKALGVSAFVLVLICGALGYVLKGSLEDLGHARTQRDSALAANKGLAESLVKTQERHREELSRLETMTKERENAVRVAQQNEATAETERDQWVLRANNLARTNHDACLNSTLPDELFDGLSTKNR